ncbi:hypothetical protein [Bacillus salipaludis]|uniref:Uncharacterized protein n=1 Tax=Bacillus salipaludis TaxID=2547811 RepID=A0AA90Z598_9BACI|nr:hypothetical protein [Bacillus salipaludis]MDQ6600802.1 hypothetical protein [Bacillus salipaludis]
MERRTLLVSSLPEYEEEIGRWLWCLEDVRRTLITELTGTSQSLIDRKLGEGQSMGHSCITLH